MCPERYFKIYKQQRLTLKTVQPNSFSKTPIAIRVNLPQFGPSVPSLVFSVLFKPFINVSSGYFYALLNLEARILQNFLTHLL